MAKQNGKWYILNKMGDKKGTSISFDGTYMLFPGGAGYIKKGDAYFFLSSNFHMSNVPYQEVHPTHDGLIRVKDNNGNYSYLNTSGDNVILANKYDACGDFSENKAWVRKNGKYGYINTRGALVIDTVFSYAEDFHNDVAYVAVGQRQGVIALSSGNSLFLVTMFESHSLLILKLFLQYMFYKFYISTKIWNFDVTVYIF